MSTNTKIDDAIVHFGGTRNVIYKMDVYHTVFARWVKAGALPPLRALQLEYFSGGKIKAVDLVDKERLVNEWKAQ